MKVLVVGGGGREHAICWKLAQSEKVDKIFWRRAMRGSRKLQSALLSERKISTEYAVLQRKTISTWRSSVRKYRWLWGS